MGKIFCLMGKSSSGKDTIFKEIIKDSSLDLDVIVSYTTRPKRIGETNGIEYYFVSNAELLEYREKGKIIEERVYNTVYGDWHYATVDDGRLDFNKSYLLITTLEAYNSLKSYYGENMVKPIYVHVDDATRLERAIEREKQQENPNYEEICRRFLADSRDFSSDNLKKSGVNKFYVNNNLLDCINEIKEYIKSDL